MVYLEEIHTKLDSFEIFKLFYNGKFSFILDSGMDPGRLGRYSFIGADPFITIESKGEQVKICEKGKASTQIGSPFKILKKLLHSCNIVNDTEIPFVGGAVGFFAYNLCRHIETLPHRAVDDLGLPDMLIGFYDSIIAIDHFSDKKYAIVPALPEITPELAREKLTKLKIRAETGVIPDYSYLDESFAGNRTELTSNFTYDEYCKAIEKIRIYIRCGDIYQANMTQRFTTQIDRHPLNIYGRLRDINPAPFASFLDYGNIQVLSSSPERFLQLRKGMIETRPIKGTMPRGRNAEEDEENCRMLGNSIKDMAENLMIVDLMRNDIGKVCKFGSVKVPELFVIEKYSTVLHMVSTVTGELRDGCDAIDSLEAVFPGGSITGAPKIRAMEIIDELEPTCRHIYTGSIGYIGFDGDMDINIVIRTILIKGDRAYYQVGGGIVWDSEPDAEYRETLDKGIALRRALLEGRKTDGSFA